MACSAMHCYIAMKYSEKNEESVKCMINGALLPDLAEDKVKSHFGNSEKPKSIKDMLDAKVGIEKCSQQLNLSNHLNKGKYLHLVTDWLYYNYMYYSNPEMQHVSDPKVLLNGIKNDAAVINDRLIDNIDMNIIPQRAKKLFDLKTTETKCSLFPDDKIDRFVDVVSSLDLSDVQTRVMADKDAFLSDFMSEMNKDYVM